MKFSNRFGTGLLAASLESEEDQVATGEEVIVEDADNVEAAMAEAAEAEVELVDTQDAIAEGAQDAETLEEVANVLEETEQEGGADPVVAQVAEVAVEAIYCRLGITKNSFASMEAFGDKAGRVEATRVSVESIRETAKNVWDAIVKLLRRGWDWLVNFVKAIFTANGRLKARATKLAAAAKDVKGAPKEATVKGKFLATLRNDNFSDKAGYLAIAGGLKSYVVEVAQVSANLGKFIEKTDPSDLVSDAAAFDAFDIKSLTTGVGAEVPANGWFAKVAAKTYAARGQKLRYIGSNVATGNLGIALAIPEEELGGSKAMYAVSKVSVVSVPVGTEDVKDAAAPALTAAEIVKIAEGVKAGAEEADRAQKDINYLAAQLKKQIADVTKLGKLMESADQGAKARGKAVAAMVRGYSRLTTGMVAAALSNSARVSRASLDYAEKSLRNLGGADAAEAK